MGKVNLSRVIWGGLLAGLILNLGEFTLNEVLLGKQWESVAIDELMTEDYVIISGGKVIRGREAFKAWVKQFQDYLLDARTENLEVFSNATGDRVVSRWICTGKNNGLLGLPRDGRPVSFTGIAIWRVKDGKLAECWVERSAWELYQELSGD